MSEADDKQGMSAPQSKVFKYIGDLDALVQAVLKSLPPSKTWQRLLLQQLSDIELKSQVLRMTLVMSRPVHEREEARMQLRVALRVAQRNVASGRADSGTKAAVGLACELGALIEGALA